MRLRSRRSLMRPTGRGRLKRVQELLAPRLKDAICEVLGAAQVRHGKTRKRIEIACHRAQLLGESVDVTCGNQERFVDQFTVAADVRRDAR